MRSHVPRRMLKSQSPSSSMGDVDDERARATPPKSAKKVSLLLPSLLLLLLAIVAAARSATSGPDGGAEAHARPVGGGRRARAAGVRAATRGIWG